MSAVFRCTWPMSTRGSIGFSACPTGVTVVSVMPPLSIERLAALLEHVDERRDPPRARLRPLRVVRAIEDRVTVLTVELLEGRHRLAVAVDPLLPLLRPPAPPSLIPR